MNSIKQTVLPLGKGFVTNPTIPYCHKRLVSTLHALTREHPCLHTEKGGCSTLGRKIPLLTLGNGKRKALFVASIHGREYLATGYLLRCIEDFSLCLRDNSLYGGFSLGRLFRDFTLYFVPMANPDGVDISLCLCKRPTGITKPPRLFKNNARNINLNANFPFLFDKVPPQRFGGKSAESEVETRFLTELCEREHFELMISFHTRGGVVYYRDSKSKRIKGDEEIAEKLRTLCGLDLMEESRSEKDFSGGFENWFRHRFKKPAFCVELVKDEKADFLQSVRNFYDAADFCRSRLIIPAAISVINQ